MNDFTKEELMDLQFFMDLYCCHSASLEIKHKKLIDKVKRFIKNYDIPLTPIVNPSKSWSPNHE